MDGYIVEYKADTAKSWTTANNGLLSSLSMTVNGLQLSTKYKFRVTAVNKAGKGTPSDESGINKIKHHTLQLLKKKNNFVCYRLIQW